MSTVPVLPPAVLLSVWEQGSGHEPVRRALTLLAAVHDGPPELAPGLDIGTRDVELAGLLRTLVGDVVSACADCPGCAELLELSVDVRAVAELPTVEPGAWMSVQVDDQLIGFRLPTSEDLLAVAGLSPLQARAAVLAACLGVVSAELPEPDVAAAVEEAMERAAPAGAVDLLVRCPECELESAVPLDVPALLWSEIDTEAAVLLRDVHDLAVRYGWTEADVLALSRRRRATYLAMVG